MGPVSRGFCSGLDTQPGCGGDPSVPSLVFVLPCCRDPSNSLFSQFRHSALVALTPTAVVRAAPNDHPEPCPLGPRSSLPPLRPRAVSLPDVLVLALLPRQSWFSVVWNKTPDNRFLPHLRGLQGSVQPPLPGCVVCVLWPGHMALRRSAGRALRPCVRAPRQ